MHRYRAFGLRIASELEVPELLPDDGEPDLEIRFGAVPESLSNPTTRGARFQATSNEFVLKVDAHARYFAANGRKIIVSREPGATDDSIRLFLLGSVMGAILHQRGLLPLHASAVEIGERAVLLMGLSGVGKSTLAAVLAQRGHRVLSDEISAVTLRDGQLEVLAGFPRLNLWADVAEKLGHKLSDLRRVRSGLEKYGLVLGKMHCDHALPIVSGYILSTTNTNELKIESLKGVAKFTALVGQTYRLLFMGEGDAKARHLELCTALAYSVPIQMLVRPELPFRATEMAEFIERELLT